MWKVVVTARSLRDLPGRHAEILKQAGCILLPLGPGEGPFAEEAMVELVREADALIVGVDPVTRRVIAAAPALKVVSKHGTGVDNIDIEAATEAGIIVANVVGTSARSVAELTLGLMISLARRLPELNNLTKSGGWSRLLGCELRGKTLGLIGLGRIGKEVAILARGLGMNVLACDIALDADFVSRWGVTPSDLGGLMRRADFVSLHAPATLQTRAMIGRREIALMKPTAFLINTARGSLVDEDALHEALTAERIAGAALDTFDVEPPKDSPLLAVPNLIATPHIGAYTQEAVERTAQIAAKNVVDVLRGRLPQETLNPQIAARARAGILRASPVGAEDP